MKYLLISLILTASALAGDGYQYEVNNSRGVVLLTARARAGEVVKLRFPVVDFDEMDEKNAAGYYDYKATFYYHERGFAPGNEFSIILTKGQKAMLENAPMVYLRRTADGWEYLGTKVSRDPKGAVIYQY